MAKGFALTTRSPSDRTRQLLVFTWDHLAIEEAAIAIDHEAAVIARSALEAADIDQELQEATEVVTVVAVTLTKSRIATRARTADELPSSVSELPTLN